MSNFTKTYYSIIFTQNDVSKIKKNKQYTHVLNLFKKISKHEIKFTEKSLKTFFEHYANFAKPNTFSIFVRFNKTLTYSSTNLSTKKEIEAYKKMGKKYGETYVFYKYKQLSRKEKLKDL